MSAGDWLGTDLELVFFADGSADLALQPGDLAAASGRDNLRQALLLRLVTWRGELGHLGHPDYGSRVDELIGASMDRLDLALLERYVRRALLSDPRVAAVTRLRVLPRASEPGVIDVQAAVKPVADNAGEIALEVALDVG